MLQYDRWVPTFWRNLLLPSSGSMNICSIQLYNVTSLTATIWTPINVSTSKLTYFENNLYFRTVHVATLILFKTNSSIPNWSIPLRLSIRILCQFITFPIHYITSVSCPLHCSFPNYRWGLPVEVCQHVITTTLKLSFPLLYFISDV